LNRFVLISGAYRRFEVWSNVKIEFAIEVNAYIPMRIVTLCARHEELVAKEVKFFVGHLFPINDVVDTSLLDKTVVEVLQHQPGRLNSKVVNDGAALASGGGVFNPFLADEGDEIEHGLDP
jgi:hypothetical protein